MRRIPISFISALVACNHRTFARLRALLVLGPEQTSLPARTGARAEARKVVASVRDYPGLKVLLQLRSKPYQLVAVSDGVGSH